MATGDISAVIDTLNFSAGFAYSMDPVHISGDINAVFYHDGTATPTGIVTTFSIDNAGNIGAVIDNLNIDPANVWGSGHIIHTSGDIYAVAFIDLGTFEIVISTFTIDNLGNIGGAVIDRQVISAAGWLRQSDNGEHKGLWHISGDIYAIDFQAGGTGFLRVVTFSIDAAGNISAAIDARDIIAINQNKNIAVCHVSGDVWLIGSTQLIHNTQMATFTIDAAGNIGAALDNATIETSAWMAPIQIIPVGLDIYAVYYYSLTDGLSKIRTFQVSDAGAITTPHLDTVNFLAAGVHPDFAMRVIGNVFAFTYDNDIRTITINYDGTIGAVIDTQALAGSHTFGLHIWNPIDDIFGVVLSTTPGIDGTVDTVQIDKTPVVVVPTLTTDPATEIGVGQSR